MTIIVFLIDTSASMNQRAYLGGRPTLLDVAKGAVETFVKVRQRSQESRGDRYMLLTFEEPPMNIKAGWKENITTFTNELKNLQCYGMTTMGAALKHAFDVLNINRMQTGIDTYGQGRCPYFLEPSVIVVITDGGRLSSNGGVHDEFNLPMHSPIPGSELTREPFRWDQRLFSLVLRLSGTPAVERDSGLVPSDSSPIDAMCEVTGGRSYCITSHRMLMQCIDSLVQKVQSGVVINFEKIGPDPPSLDINMDMDSKDGENTLDVDERNGFRGGNFPTAWHSCRRLIYVPRTIAQKGFAIGYWPIPESFWPDLGAAALPARSAHPNVKFNCTGQEPMVIENLPFDKYELEPSPLTQYILARKQPTVCWQIFVANSSKNGEIGHPFGYLKASTNLSCVNMFVMPYNYPVLLPLLEELFKVHRCKPSNDWKTQFGNYLRTMPPYYAAPLRRALIRMGAPAPLASALITDSMENSLSYLVLNYLKRAKTQAKIEFDKLCNEVISKQNNSKINTPNETVRVIARSPFKKDLLSHPQLQDKFATLREQLNDFSGFVVGLSKTRQKNSCSYRNPFDISRSVLLDQVVRMRANFLQPSLSHTQLVDDDSMHSMPVGQMGNYQEHLKRMTPQLRELESAPVRQHMFGNPFKIDKRMMVDEADIDLVGSTSKSPKRPLTPTEPMSPRTNNKRKAGPIPRDFHFNRPSTPVHEPAHAPSTQSQVYATPASPAHMGAGYSNTPLLPPIYTMNSDVIAGLASSVVTAHVQSPVTPPASPLSWSTLSSPGISSPIQSISVNHGTPSQEPDIASIISNSLENVPDIPLQDSGGKQMPQLDYRLVNGDSKLFQPELLRPRSPSPTLPYNPAPADADRPLPTYSNHVKSTFNSNLSQEKQISMILQEVNANGGDLVSRTNTNSNKKLTNGPSDDRALTKQDLIDIQKHNLNVRKLVYKEVRRPGRNFVPLFNHLETIKGSLDVRVPLLKEIIKESLRFKRKTLASLLEEFLKKMQNGCQPQYKDIQLIISKNSV